MPLLFTTSLQELSCLRVSLRGILRGVMGAEPLEVGTHGLREGVTCLHMAKAAKLGKDLHDPLLLHWNHF